METQNKPERDGKESWEDRFGILMKELPVNDHRLHHTDLITGQVVNTARGIVIQEFIRSERLVAQKLLLEAILANQCRHGVVGKYVKVEDILSAARELGIK